MESTKHYLVYTHPELGRVRFVTQFDNDSFEVFQEIGLPSGCAAIHFTQTDLEAGGIRVQALAKVPVFHTDHSAHIWEKGGPTYLPPTMDVFDYFKTVDKEWYEKWERYTNSINQTRKDNIDSFIMSIQVSEYIRQKEGF